MPEMLTLEAFEEASEKVKEVTLETKLIESPYLSAATGNRMWLKPENMQRTGAYKLVTAAAARTIRSRSSPRRSLTAA